MGVETIQRASLAADLERYLSNWKIRDRFDDEESSKFLMISQEHIEVMPSSMGLVVEIPHMDGDIIVRHCLERAPSVAIPYGSIVILRAKDLTYKLTVKDPQSIARELTNLHNQVSGDVAEFVSGRLQKAKNVPASIEECLSVVEKTLGAATTALNIDEALAAHGMASPADKWEQFRHQANTPNSRLDLICVLSEYSSRCRTEEASYKAMVEAGDILITPGDLEARPAWLFWDRK